MPSVGDDGKGEGRGPRFHRCDGSKWAAQPVEAPFKAVGYSGGRSMLDVATKQAKRPIVLRGATGPTSALVNGTYYLTADRLNGKPVYAKKGDAGRWLFFAKDKTWSVANTDDKEGNKTSCLAYTEIGLADPAKAKVWKVHDGNKWNAQPVKCSIMASVDYLYLAMGLGDVYGLDLALEAVEGSPKALATARAELARLEGVARRFGTPGRESVAVQFEEAEDGWVAHEMRVDTCGRLTIKTRPAAIYLKRLAAALDVEAMKQAVDAAEAAGYSEGRLMLDAVTKQLTRPVVLRGAMGQYSTLVNGTYYLTAERLNGKPVYAKEGDTNYWLYFSTDKKWLVAQTTNKEGNKTSCFAHTEANLAHPAAAKALYVHDGNEHVAQQVQVTIMTSLDFLALALGSGDVYGLGLALEAAEGDEPEATATARVELARLEGVARRFEMPAIRRTLTHTELVEGELVDHVASRDCSGRLTIKTQLKSALCSLCNEDVRSDRSRITDGLGKFMHSCCAHLKPVVSLDQRFQGACSGTSGERVELLTAIERHAAASWSDGSADQETIIRGLRPPPDAEAFKSGSLRLKRAFSERTMRALAILEATHGVADAALGTDIVERDRGMGEDARVSLVFAVAAGDLGLAATMALAPANGARSLPPAKPKGQANDSSAGRPDEGTELTCAVCCETLDRSTSPGGVVSCLGRNHKLHPSCAADLLLGDAACPLCREPLFHTRSKGLVSLDRRALAGDSFIKHGGDSVLPRRLDSLQVELASLATERAAVARSFKQLPPRSSCLGGNGHRVASTSKVPCGFRLPSMVGLLRAAVYAAERTIAEAAAPATRSWGRHLLGLAASWEPCCEVDLVLGYLAAGDLDSAAREVRRYNAARVWENLLWADAANDNQQMYRFDASSVFKLRVDPDMRAPFLTSKLSKGMCFQATAERLDLEGINWLKVSGVTSVMSGATSGATIGSPGDEGGKKYQVERKRFPRPEAAALQGWLKLRPGGPESRAVANAVGGALRCFCCGDNLEPFTEAFAPVTTLCAGEPVFVVKSHAIATVMSVVPPEVPRELLQSETLPPSLYWGCPECTLENCIGSKACGACGAREVAPAPVAVASIPEEATVRCSFPGPWDDGDGETYLCKPSELLRSLPGTSGADELRVVRGRPRSRRELFLDGGKDVRAARAAWRAAAPYTPGPLPSPTMPTARAPPLFRPPFATCLRGHPFHARCFQGLLVGGGGCPACGEELSVPSSTIKAGAAADDGSSCSSYAGDAGLAHAAAVVQVAVDAVSSSAATVQQAAAAGSSLLGGATLRMCPTCFAGPLLNENCDDLTRHHGECPRCNMMISNAKATIAAAMSKLKEGGRVCDVLPKCAKCVVPVTFNGCGSCGFTFNSLRWAQLPVWDSTACAQVDLETKRQAATKLLIAQVRAEAAALRFERAALARDQATLARPEGDGAARTAVDLTGPASWEIAQERAGPAPCSSLGPSRREPPSPRERRCSPVLDSLSCSLVPQPPPQPSEPAQISWRFLKDYALAGSEDGHDDYDYMWRHRSSDWLH